MVLLLHAGLVLAFAHGTVSCTGEGPEGERPLRDASRALLRGRVFHASDVTTVPDAPYAQGRVLAVPWAQFVARLDALGIEPTTRRPRIAIGEHELAALSRLEPDGAYALRIEPGHYALCVSGLGDRSMERTDFPVVADSCVDVSIGDGESVLDLWFGIAGLSRRAGRTP